MEMRMKVAHLIVTLDGVAKFDAVLPTIMKLRDAEEALPDFFAKVAAEDAMLLGRITYKEWAQYWPTSTVESFASHINNVSKFVVSTTLDSTPWGTQGNAKLIRGNLADAISTLKQ